VEAKIFESATSPVERRDHPFRLFANAIGANATEEPPIARCSGATSGRSEIPGPGGLRPAEVRHHDDLSAPRDQRLDGRRQPLDPSRIGDDAVLTGRSDRHAAARSCYGHRVVESSKSRHQTGSLDLPLRCGLPHGDVGRA